MEFWRISLVVIVIVLLMVMLVLVGEDKVKDKEECIE